MWQGIVKSIKICWMEDWYSELCIILNSKKDAYTFFQTVDSVETKDEAPLDEMVSQGSR